MSIMLAQHLRHRVHDGIVFADGAFRSIGQASGQIGTEGAGLHGCHENAEIVHLLAQRLRQSLQCESARVIDAKTRNVVMPPIEVTLIIRPRRRLRIPGGTALIITGCRRS